MRRRRPRAWPPAARVASRKSPCRGQIPASSTCCVDAVPRLPKRDCCVGGSGAEPPFTARLRRTALLDLRRSFLGPACDHLGRLLAAVASTLLFTGLRAQAPSPGGEAPAARAWQQQGASLLEAEDPLGAWDAFRRALADGTVVVESQIGLGRVHLMLGRSCFALAYAEAAIAGEPANQKAMALCVRALIRARAFDEAVA